jgi:uncharacterized phage protein gp47/JayE
MAKVTYKSERQIQTDILAKIIAELGLNDVNTGSVLDRITQAVAQEDFAQYVAMAQIARLVNLDAITKDDLDNKAFEYGLTRRQAQKARGKIDILRPSTFVKVSTTFFAGSPAPIMGDTIIDVNTASSSLIGTSGTLILGRGTSNEEEVTYTSAPVNNTNYYRFTVSALAQNHSVEETVILKQGNNESILAGTSVRVSSTGTSAEILFTIDDDVVLLAGEDKVTAVDISAVTAGTAGNIPIRAIEGVSAFTSAPFTGARAENTSKFTSGRDRETDNELRDGIRNHVQSLSRGVKQAIKNAIVGLVDSVTAKRVVSANVILPQSTAEAVKIYIDDSTGFEPDFLSQGLETVVARATGGETRLQLDIKPLVKAQVENNLEEPYDMSGGTKPFTYQVGTTSETVTFASSDFQFPDTATAEEIVAALNDRSTLIEARTSQSGKQVVIMAKADTNEAIQVTGGSANAILAFPTDLKNTLFLYIDDVLKSKDGETATIDSGNQSPYNLAAISAGPWTLTVIVDGKTANPQTVTFSSSDFADTTSATVAEIVAVINAQLAGAEALAVNSNTKVRIRSNTELSSRSKIRITGGTINNVSNGLNFSTVQKVGINGDYTLNRELGTIELATPLTANQSVSVASIYTRASVRASIPELYAPSVGETLDISVDGGATQTITFDSTFAPGLSAVNTASYINARLLGATAIVRQIGTRNFLEIRTNTYDDSGLGTLVILSSSTANASFGFTLNTTATNQRPHKAYRMSGNAGPYEFSEADSLVLVLDNDIVNNTFSITMDYDATLTAVTSTTVFRAAALANIFQTDDVLVDFYAAFTNGPNTRTGTVTSVTDQAGDTWRYVFSALPTGLAAIAAGSLVKFTGLTNSSNNGYFLVTAVNTTGNGYIEVTNASGVAETGSSGTALMSLRRRITDYTASTGAITVNSAFTTLPVIANNLIVIPSTVKNLTDFINNTKITSFSLKGIVEGVVNNTKLQLSSKAEGSNGYIQISGGKANDKLSFSTTVFRGLQAYNYYTGLLELVHKTIYGDDQDLVSFPGVGAAGIKFQVLAPTVKELSINIDVTLEEGISLASLENSIKSAISGYINNLGVGEDVIIERIRSAVIGIRGVRDVVLNTPTANIAIADNELARTRDALMIVG